MPYKSDAQRKYFNANRKELESQGVDVDEWNQSSKGKKLPEKVKNKEKEAAFLSLRAADLAERASALLIKMAEKPSEPATKKKPKASDIVNMSSGHGLAADLIGASDWGGERSGRTQAMADAIDEPTTFGVRHPLTQTLGYAVPSALLGGLAGGAAGFGLGELTNSPSPGNITAGAGLGSGLGTLLGTLLAGYSRRKEMNRINQLYDEDAEAGRVNPRDPKFSALSALLFPGRGPHRTGQLEAVRAMRGERSIADQHNDARDVLYGLGRIPYVGSLPRALHGYGQNIKTQFASGAVPRKAERRNTQRAREYKEKVARNLNIGAGTNGISARQLSNTPSVLKQGNERGFLQSMLDEVRRKVEGARVAELARKYAPGALGGAAAGAGMGLLSDPGHDEEGKRRSRFSSLPANALGGAALGIGAQHFAPQISEYIGSGGRERGVDLYNRSKAVNSFNKLAESSGDRDYGDEKNQKSEAKKDKKHQARTKLGPLEHAYVADAMGGQALQNTSRKLKEMHKDPDNPYKSLYDRLVTSQAGLNEGLGERISRGSARMAESPVWRALSMLDPTVTGKNEGLVGAMSGFGGGEDKAQGAKRRAAEAYAKFLKKHQDKVDPEAKTTERETPFHINAQGMLANLDSDIAGHKYMRNERPLHYWLNPMNKSGPLSELTDRGVRRIVAGNASPESNAGRLGMTVGGLATLGLLPMITGGEQAQQKLRASAVKNRLYAPEAMPEEKAASVIELLARTMAKQARCWKGYEPVPGKKPYSEDSCRPAGSGKKKEKKASGCGGGNGKCDNCGTAPCECNSDSDIKQLAKVSALHTLPR
jgi:hypothetical protein